MIRIFKLLIPASVLALLLSEILIISASYVSVAYLTPDLDPDYFLFAEAGIWRIAIVVVVILLGLDFNDLYSKFHLPSRIGLFQQLCLTIGTAFLAQALLSYTMNGVWTLPRKMMILGSAIAMAALFCWRLLFHHAIQKSIGARKMLFLGASPIVFELGEYLRDHPENGLKPVGYLDSFQGPVTAGHTSMSRLGTSQDLITVLDEVQPDWLIISRREQIKPAFLDELLGFRFGGIQTEAAEDLYETTFGRVCSGEIKPSELILRDAFNPQVVRLRLKAMYTYLLALIVILPASVLILMITLLLKLASPRERVFVREERIGWNDAPLTTLRFRPAPTLRRFRLDGLPLLLHVFMGQMSLVGPWPERIEYVRRLNELIPYYRQRHRVKPGLVAWADVSQENIGPLDTLRRLEYDLYYIKNISPSLDVYVLFRSFKIMFRHFVHGGARR